ncbi:MAG: hypothetical protein AAF789_01015 [Bacteroidota bacterium]
MISCWLLAVGCWLLAVGCWLLAVGCWLLAGRTFTKDMSFGTRNYNSIMWCLIAYLTSSVWFLSCSFS